MHEYDHFRGVEVYASKNLVTLDFMGWSYWYCNILDQHMCIFNNRL